MDNKLTMKSLSEMLGDAETVNVEIAEGALAGVTLSIRKTLTMNDAMRLVANVVNSCVDMQNAEYTPEAYDLALRSNTVAYYANITFGKYDVNKVYRLMYETDIYPIVLNAINYDQHCVLVEAIENRIDYLKNMLTSTAANKTMEMLAQLNEFAGAAATMTEQMQSMNLEKTLDDALSAMSKQAVPVTQEPAAQDNEHKVLIMKKKKD